MDGYKYAIFEALCDLAKKHDISIYKLLLKPDTPDVASPADNSVIMNPNFETQVTYNYRLAHELSHILYGDHEAQAVYQFSEYGKRGEELLGLSSKEEPFTAPSLKEGLDFETLKKNIQKR